MAGNGDSKSGSLSTNLLNMKFMQRGSPTPEKKESKPHSVNFGDGWAIPNAHKLRPKKVYQSPITVGFAELEEPTFGRMVWKNGKCKQVLEDEPKEEEVEEVKPEQAKRKHAKSERKTSNSKKKSKR